MSPDDPGADDPLGLHGVVPPTITAFDAGEQSRPREGGALSRDHERSQSDLSNDSPSSLSQAQENEDESVDLAATATHARFVVDRGAHGVFALGTNGEFPLLTAEERDRVVEAVVDEVGDEVPVLAGVGAEGTRKAIERARAAEDAGADGLVVVDPYYYPVDEDGLVEHFRRVADAVDCPIYAYTFPDMSGNDLTVDALGRLAEIDGFAGIKDTSQDVARMQTALREHPDLTYLMGSNRLVYVGLSLGCAGAVSAVANVFPELVVDLYEAVREGDDERARELQSDVSDVQEALERGPTLAGVKAALDLRGFDVGPMRSPLRSFSDEQREALRETIEELYDEGTLAVDG